MNIFQTITITETEKIGSVSKSEFSRLEIVTYMGVLIIGVIALFLVSFSGQSLRLDESQSLWQTSHSFSTMIGIVAEDVHVPLYHILLHYWQILFGSNAASARILSLTFFVLMIPAIYLLGRKAFGQIVGLFAALLVAISPFLNWYGSEIRMYSLFAFLAIINQYFFLHLFSDTGISRHKASGWSWLGFGATMILGIFTHYFFFFIAITQAIFYFMYRRKFPKNSLRKFVVVMLIMLAVFTPWLYFVINHGAAGNTQPLLSKPTPVDLFNTFFEFVFGFQTDRTNTIMISLWPLAVLFIFLSLRRNQKIPPSAVYLFFSLLIPVLLAYAVSSTFKPLYLARYMILTLPAFYILISWIFSTYPPRLSRFLKSTLVIGMAAMLTIQIVNANTPVKENYREASDYLMRQVTARDIVVVSAPFTIYPFEYYYKGAARVDTLPIWNRYQAGPIPQYSPEQIEKDVDILADAHDKLWLLLSYDQGYEEDVRLYFDTRFERVDSRNFSPGLNLYAYKLRYDIEDLQATLGRINSVNSSPLTVSEQGE